LNTLHSLFDKWSDTADFSAGSLILSEDAPASVVFVVLSGEIELSLRGVSLGRVVAGGIIGEMAMIGSATGNPTAKAVTDVRLARLDRDQFNRMIANHPEFSLHALSAMASRLRAMNSFVEAQLGSRE
jgi:CRP/FNR family cyclic AMP-dependent transcriptional regulator